MKAPRDVNVDNHANNGDEDNKMMLNWQLTTSARNLSMNNDNIEKLHYKIY